ncbi:hypothetical protein LC55x_3216 [Lysobacter capsici]|nr:hypothetical protein LC55x_3216 [Lysobacter capsici]
MIGLRGAGFNRKRCGRFEPRIRNVPRARPQRDATPSRARVAIFTSVTPRAL